MMALLLIACATSAPLTENLPLDAKALKTHVDALTASLPLTAAKAEAQLGVTLTRGSQGSNKYFDVASGEGSGALTRVEVREPSPASVQRGKHGMVLLTLSNCLKAEQIEPVFGTPPPAPPDVPRPEQQQLPEYKEMEQSWGVLRFGYARDTGCLVSVVIDANE